MISNRLDQIMVRVTPTDELITVHASDRVIVDQPPIGSFLHLIDINFYYDRKRVISNELDYRSMEDE